MHVQTLHVYPDLRDMLLSLAYKGLTVCWCCRPMWWLCTSLVTR